MPITEHRFVPERRFFLAMALALLTAVLLGFFRSFLLRPLFPEWPSPHENIFYIHGVLFTAWILLLVLQTSFITVGRSDLHRRVGPVGGLLAVAMLAIGVVGALTAAGRVTGFVGIPVPPLQFLAIPLFDMLLFPVFVWVGIANRRDQQSHKRWMLLATVNLVTAAIARWPGMAPFGPLAFFGVTDMFIVALAIWDLRTRGSFYPATMWGGLLIIASQPLRLAISGTAAWLSFAQWATALIL